MRNLESTNKPHEKEITDLQMIGKVISSLFPRIPVSMYHENVQTPIQVISANQEGLVIKSTDRLDDGIRILTFTNNFSLYHFWFELSQGSNKDIEFLKPLKMVIRDEPKRVEQRVVVTKKVGYKPFVSLITSTEFISRKYEKIKSFTDLIWNEEFKKIQNKYNSCTIKIGEKENLRLKILKSNPRPIFLNKPGKIEPYNTAFYNPVLFKDLLSSTNDPEPLIGAEITIPIFYGNKILLGYVQVRANESLEMEDFNQINSIAISIMEKINKWDELILLKDKYDILDISSNGLGFIAPFSEENLNIFTQGQILLFEINLEDNKKIPMKVVVRFSSKQDQSLIRIGCEFYDLTLEEKAKIRDYSKNINIASKS